MSSRSWNVATAKAELSRVLRGAKRGPQVIERRGEPIAVVIGIETYRRLADRDRASRRWQGFLELSASLRAEGGAELELPPRVPRSSPFGRKRP